MTHWQRWISQPQTLWLRKARLVRTSLDVNGSICRSLLEIRSRRGAELEEVGT